jgi:hypothetical protein
MTATRTTQRIIAASAVAVLSLGFVACDDDDDGDDVEQEIDEGVDDVQDEVDEGVDEVEEEVDE